MYIWPPKLEILVKNVKCAYVQCQYGFPPNLNLTVYGWKHDELNRVLQPKGIPFEVTPAPAEIIKLIKCICSSTKQCPMRRCSCSGNVPKSLMFTISMWSLLATYPQSTRWINRIIYFVVHWDSKETFSLLLGCVSWNLESNFKSF